MADVLDRKITLPDLIRKTATAPAALIGIPPSGFAPGDRADFALYLRSAVTIEPEILHSKCGWTPFEGHRAIFPKTVILGGTVAYREGEFFRARPTWYPGKGYIPPSDQRVVPDLVRSQHETLKSPHDR